MEQETIVYFYPVEPEKGIPGKLNAAAGFMPRNISLEMRVLGDVRDALCVTGCAVPPYYRRNKPWKPQMLSEVMERVVHRADGLADAVVHPRVISMLEDAYDGRWQTRNSTELLLLKQLMEQYAPDALLGCGEVVILLGDFADTRWQMDMTRELLQPYLSRINRLLIFYEDAPETDVWEELGIHLDSYYYDYGLVPQLEAYADAENGKRCRKHRCRGVIIDYCNQYRYPKIMPDDRAVYVDAVSVGDKARLLGRKTPQIPYVSPLKYLDTMVKNSYDRLLVN